MRIADPTPDKPARFRPKHCGFVFQQGRVTSAAIGVVLGLIGGRRWTRPLANLAGRSSGLVGVPVQAESVLVGVAVAILALTVVTIIGFSQRLRGVTAHSLIRDGPGACAQPGMAWLRQVSESFSRDSELCGGKTKVPPIRVTA